MGIQDGPYYRLSASELAAWIEQQGVDIWWNVDGDSILTSRISFPCPGDELADELRRVHRVLLVQDPRKGAEARGQEVDRTAVDGLVDVLGTDSAIGGGTKPAWSNDRLLYLCWEGSEEEWLLVEDRETTENSRNDLVVRSND